MTLYLYKIREEKLNCINFCANFDDRNEREKRERWGLWRTVLNYGGIIRNLELIDCFILFFLVVSLRNGFYKEFKKWVL